MHIYLYIYRYQVLGLNYAHGLENVGGVNWILALCLFGVFFIVYFAMWRGVKSSGKVSFLLKFQPFNMISVDYLLLFLNDNLGRILSFIVT